MLDKFLDGPVLLLAFFALLAYYMLSSVDGKAAWIRKNWATLCQRFKEWQLRTPIHEYRAPVEVVEEEEEKYNTNTLHDSFFVLWCWVSTPFWFVRRAFFPTDKRE